MKFLTDFFLKLRPSKAKLEIYTDGSHKGKWGSWAFVIVQNDKIIHESSGRVRSANSHRMEFQAAIEALSYLKAGTAARVYSDSRVLINSVLNLQDRPRINSDQIEEIDRLVALNNVSWQWVRAHAGVKYNERCDQLCIQARS